MLRNVFGPQERLLNKVLERVERCQGSKPDELLQARFEEAHGDKKRSLQSWLLAQAFPKTGETPSLGEDEASRPGGAPYLYLPRSSLTALPSPHQHVCKRPDLPGLHGEPCLGRP